MIPPQAFQGVICLDNRKSFLCVINILVVLSLSESPALSKENSNTEGCKCYDHPGATHREQRLKVPLMGRISARGEARSQMVPFGDIWQSMASPGRKEKNE